MKLAAFFWHYARRYTLWMVLALATVLIYSAATAAMVGLIEPIFGEVLLAEKSDRPEVLGVLEDTKVEAPGEPREAPPSSLERLKEKLNLKHRLDEGYASLKRRCGVSGDQVIWFVPLLFVAFFLLRCAVDFLSGYAFQRVGLGITTDIRDQLYRRILNQSSRFFAAHSSGELVTRVVSDVTVMQNAVSNRLLDLLQQSLTLVSLMVLLLSTHFRLALICLVVAPILLLPIVRFGKGMRKTSHRSQERLAEVTAVLAEGVRGYRVVKAFGMEEFEVAKFSEATHRHLKISLRAQMIANLSSPVVESLAALGSAALLIYAGQAIRAETLTPPMLIGFLSNLLLMYDPIRKLNKVNLVLQQALAAGQRVSSMIELESEIVDRPAALPISGVSEGIAYQGVGFAYEGAEQPVLEQVDLDIRCGEMVALVGPSGAGKTTLVNLLPRFFDPDRGRVTIDGHDLRDLRLADLRALIGIVTQETVLFADTIRNNIAYGRSDLPLDKVRRAAEAAYAHEFIEHLPKGYDTQVGEAGLRLSGGQRQRIAIARALLKNAPILILDEATSQLDTESEAWVQKALVNLMRDRTTLVIAHRLSTVMRADRIVVMDGGRIVEAGSHAELIQQGGLYQRLYELQFQE